MMKIQITTLALLASCIASATQVPLEDLTAKKWRGRGVVDYTLTDHGELTVRAHANEAEAGKKREDMVAYVQMPLTIPADANGISFEVKGNGLERLATVFLAEGHPHSGFEAAFSLKNQEWSEVVIPLTDFNRVHGTPHSGSYNTFLEPTSIRNIAFGRGRAFHRFNLSDWEYSVRNLQILTDLEVPQVPANYSKGLERTTSLIRAGKPIKILMLGDSITESGREHSYAHMMAERLKEEYGIDCEIANAGIGGHTVRAGRTVFQRSFAKMDDPDLVTIFYGANDCWAAVQKGMTVDDFQTQIEALIDTVRIATDGKADIMLFTGVQRLDKETRTESRGVIELIAPGIYAAAESRETALCDTLTIYADISQEKRMEVYNDTIHPKEEGHVFLGGIFFDTVVDYLNKGFASDR